LHRHELKQKQFAHIFRANYTSDSVNTLSVDHKITVVLIKFISCKQDKIWA